MKRRSKIAAIVTAAALTVGLAVGVVTEAIDECTVRVPVGGDIETEVQKVPTGATICLGVGEYRASRNITPKTGQSIIGAGADQTVVRGAGATIVFDAKASSGVRLQDFHIQGSSTPGKDVCKECGGGARLGPNGRVFGMRFSGHPNHGMGGSENGLVVENSEFDHNGSNDYLGCCAGGLKSANSVTIRRSTFHDNIGNGAWVDTPVSGEEDFLVEDSFVLNNTRAGLKWENRQNASNSSNVIFRRNVIRGHGEEHVEINSSSHALVTGNEFGPGVAVRIGGGRAPTTDVVVKDNYMNGSVINGCTGAFVCTPNFAKGTIPPDDPAPTPSPSPTASPPRRVCNNGVDDDSDGRTDFPADPGCSKKRDRTENSDNPTPLPTPTPEPTPTPDPVTGLTVAVVGDLCERTLSSCQPVANRIKAEGIEHVILPGDLQYPAGALADYRTYFGKVFTDFNLLPAPGNHDYERSSTGAGYYDYFAGTPSEYVTVLSGWTIYSADSERIERAASHFAQSPDPVTECVAGFWHRPRYSSGDNHNSETGEDVGESKAIQPLVDAMVARDVDLILNGHSHNYERFAMKDGYVQFIAGQGGHDTDKFGTVVPHSEFRYAGTAGFLKLTLGDGKWSSEYTLVDGTVKDRVNGVC